jgi:hypothetical protein
MEEEWKQVSSKKYSKKPERKTPLKCYWNGFDENGKERWFIEFTNGSIISNKDSTYNFWSKRVYSLMK